MRYTSVTKFALLLFLPIANVAVAPFSCYITAERYLEVVLYRSIDYPTGEEKDRAIAELYPLFVSMYPNNDVYFGYSGPNHFVIFMYDQPRILSPTLIVFVLMLNALCILAIAYPTKILCSRESTYYTKQRRKILFYGTGEMYFWESVMKHNS
jgi:hypothetical protein